MALVCDQCICLRKFEYSETSQILTLLSRQHGLLKALAKGAHRRTKAGASKFDGGVDLLDAGQAVFTDDANRELATLTEWKLLEGHLQLRKNLRGVYLGLYAAELVSLLIEAHDPHEALFDALAALLPVLASNRREEAFLAFELELLRETGYEPRLTHCAGCDRPLEPRREAEAYSPSRGGLLCRECAAVQPDRQGIDPRLVRLLRTMQAAVGGEGPRRLPQLTRAQTDPLNRMLVEHMQHTLGRSLRAAEYVLGARENLSKGKRNGVPEVVCKAAEAEA